MLAFKFIKRKQSQSLMNIAKNNCAKQFPDRCKVYTYKSKLAI